MLAIDDDRFREAFEEYPAIGATENDGLHRLALTDADKAVRDRFVEDLETPGWTFGSTASETSSVAVRAPTTTRRC
jgi:N-carbamoyl-L-amino-acid hydrolase